MKSTLIFWLLLFSILKSNAQYTNCSPTFSEIYDFEVGDEFLYGIKENPGGGTQDYWQSTQTITILNKIISGDTIIYYRELNGTLRDTLVIIRSDSTHFLNQCDSSIVKVNSLSHYKNYPTGVQDIYSYIRVYNNDTVRTWDNVHPRIVKAVGGFSHNNAFYTRSDSGTYEPIDANFDGPHFLVEYAAGSGLLYEGHDDFESWYERRLIHKINGTDTTVYHAASIHKSQLQPLQFSVFPNPVKEKLTLKFDNATATKFSILNTTGQIIKTGETQSKNHTIILEDLPAGIYFIDIESDESNGTLRFIKE